MTLAEELIGSDTHMHRSDLVNSLHAKLNVISASAEELLATIEPKTEIDVKKAEAKPAVAKPAAAILTDTATLGQKMAATLAAEKPKTKAKVAVTQPVITLEEKLADFYGVKQLDGQVVFSTMYPRAREVQIAGDFNGWQPQTTIVSRKSPIPANGN